VDFIDLLATLLVCLLAAIIFMTGVFLVGHRLRRYDIVDSAWGLAFITISTTALFVSSTMYVVDLLVYVLVLVWGLRLSNHIFARFRSMTSEDKRYVALRKKWRAGNENVAIFFRIYIVQALLATIICLPVIVIYSSIVDVSLSFVIVGSIIWAIGFAIEVLADLQLRRFIRNPQNKGQLMTAGLWRYSRHPNYFGELTLWWGVGIIALGAPFGWIGLVGPVVISYLIIFVSGVPLTEKAYIGRSGWAEYKQRTSVLVPWFVHKDTRA
jgi:steroid 5-alpha reductase family enzyme